MNENPFKYVPEAANLLKSLEKDSKEYMYAFDRLMKRNAFVAKLVDCANTNDDDEFRPQKLKLSDATSQLITSIVFIPIAIIAFLVFAIYNKTIPHRFLVYALLAALIALIFTLHYGRKMSDQLFNIADFFLEKYKASALCTETVKLVIDVRTSITDVIAPGELSQKIECGCYSCMSKFTSDMLKPGEDIHSNEYVCPVCGKTTVISARCGHEITDSLLKDMHDYWTEK